MLEDQQRADGVDFEALEGVVGVDLAGGSLGVQDAGDGVGEAEVVRFGGEHLARLVGGGGDCEFVCVVAGYVRDGLLVRVVEGMSGMGRGLLPTQSSSSTVRRSTSTFFRPSRSEFRTSSVLLREVARMGAFVVCRRCLVSANPIPREAGETKHHAIFLWGL